MSQDALDAGRPGAEATQWTVAVALPGGPANRHVARHVLFPDELWRWWRKVSSGLGPLGTCRSHY